MRSPHPPPSLPSPSLSPPLDSLTGARVNSRKFIMRKRGRANIASVFILSVLWAKALHVQAWPPMFTRHSPFAIAAVLTRACVRTPAFKRTRSHERTAESSASLQGNVRGVTNRWQNFSEARRCAAPVSDFNPCKLEWNQMDLDESGARTLTCACLIFNAATRLGLTKREGRSYIFGNWLTESCFGCQWAVPHPGCIHCRLPRSGYLDVRSINGNQVVLASS